MLKGDPFTMVDDDSRHLVEDFCAKFTVESQLRQPSPFVKEMMSKAEKARKEHTERKRNDFHYWFTEGSEKKVFFPFDVSRQTEKRVLRIIDTLDKELYKIEGFVFIDNVALKNSYKTEEVLCLSLFYRKFLIRITEKSNHLHLAAQSDDGSFKTTLSDTDAHTVEECLGELLLNMFLEADRRRSKAEIESRKFKRARQASNKKNRIDSWGSESANLRGSLPVVISDWKKSLEIRRFADEIRLLAESLPSPKEKAELENVAAWADADADAVDPVVSYGRNEGALKQLTNSLRASQEKACWDYDHRFKYGWVPEFDDFA